MLVIVYIPNLTHKKGWDNQKWKRKNIRGGKRKKITILYRYQTTDINDKFTPVFFPLSE